MTIPSVFGKVIAAGEDLKKLDKASKALEADMFKRFLKEASPKGGMFGDSSKSPGSGIYGDMGRDALADSLAEKGTLGISRAIFSSMAPTVVAQVHTPAVPNAAVPAATTPTKSAKADLTTPHPSVTTPGIARS